MPEPAKKATAKKAASPLVDLPVTNLTVWDDRNKTHRFNVVHYEIAPGGHLVIRNANHRIIHVFGRWHRLTTA